MSINPSNEEILGEFEEYTNDQIADRISIAQNAFENWQGRSINERTTLLLDLAAALRKDSKHLSTVITNEIGKPITASEAEIEKCAICAEYYAVNLQNFLEQQLVQTDATESYVQFDPLGVVLGIMPWNFPFWQAIRFALPAIAAGNVALLKHSSNASKSAIELETVFKEAGFPTGVFQVLLLSSERIERLLSDPIIKAVSLTGSERAGRSVAEIAGKYLKKCVLELGGSDPFIVLDDADPAEAAKVAAESRCVNNGQSCIAAKRFIVHEKIYEEFLRFFKAEIEGKRVGDPNDQSTQIGPLATEKALSTIQDQLKRAIELGAEVLTGGKQLEQKGYFFQPTIVTNLSKNSPLLTEEVFGPIAPIIKVSSAEEAIELANSSEYGLGAAIWSRSIDRAKQLATRLQNGTVFINGLVKSDPRLPFGGVKSSGFGRELSHFALFEFTNIKSIWIR